jgi:flagellar hook assembly protein FlgD
VEKSGQLNGPQVILWDGRDEGGELVPPGVYLVRLSIDTDTGTEERSLAVGVAY